VKVVISEVAVLRVVSNFVNWDMSRFGFDSKIQGPNVVYFETENQL
jgi:hypothetical protein